MDRDIGKIPNKIGVVAQDSSVVKIGTLDLGAELQERTGIPNSIPFSGDTPFVGREPELEQLHKMLQAQGTVAIAAVQGLGGIGKTELAIRYATRHIHEYPGGICWCFCRGEDVGVQILQFATGVLALTPPQDQELEIQLRYCWSHWPEGGVLVVLDDLTNWRSVQKVLPSGSSRFKVLITTRRELSPSLQKLALGVLDLEAALQLLRDLSGAERVQREPEAAQQLCGWLGCLPLGLELVGRYLAQRPDLSLGEMMRRLQQKRLQQRALQTPEDPGDMTRTLGIRDVFEFSWQALSGGAQRLGCLLSVFAQAPISWGLVPQCDPEQDPEDLEDSLAELVRLNLVEREGEGLYHLHQLVREYLLEKLDENVASHDLKQLFVHGMVEQARQIPEDPTQEVIQKMKQVIPHLAEVVGRWDGVLKDEEWIWPYEGLGRYYEGQGLYGEAELWRKECAGRSWERLGEEHPDVASSLNNLALLYRSQGRYREAEALFQQSLELRQKLLGEEHPDVASSLNNLALLYRSQGQYVEAEPLYRQSLELRQKLLGEEHPDVASSLNNLALLYRSQGRYEEAEPLYRQSLELYQRLLGEEHPSVAISLNNLARLYDLQDRYEEAEPLYQRSLELYQKLLGVDHPSVAISLNNLAELYRSQGKYVEAEPLHQRSLELKRKLLGPDHPSVANSLHNLARLQRDQGKYEEAESLFRQSLEIRRKLLGEEHPDVATSFYNLGLLYRLQGRYEEADPLYTAALQIFFCRLGADHPDTQVVAYNHQLLLKEVVRIEGSALSTLQNQGSEMTQQILNQMLRPEEST